MRKKLSFTLTIFFICLFAFSVKGQRFVWARQSITSSYAQDPIIEDNGNSYIGGNFTDSAFFDGQRILGTSTESGRQNIYLAKFDPMGKLIRAIRNGGPGLADLIGMCRDNSNHIYLLGGFEDTVNFGSIRIGGDIGIFSYFIAKCDTAGNFLWVKAYNNSFSGSNYGIRLAAIACDRQDNVYILGNADGTYSGNGISFSGNGYGLFVSRISPLTGMGVWTRTIDGNAYKFPKKILTDYNNDVIVAGEFGSATFPIPGTSCIFNNTDSFFTGNGISANVFVAKYSASGTYKWAKAAGTPPFNEYGGIVCDSGRNIFLTGQFGDTSNGAYTSQPMLKKMNAAGQSLWINSVNAYIQALTSSSTGLYMLAGFTDSFAYGGQVIRENGEQNVILKFDTVAGNLLWTSQRSGYNGSFAGVSASNRGTVLYCGIGAKYGLKFGNSFLYNNDNAFTFVSILNDTTYTPIGNNRITGNIFNDATPDCIKASNEAGLSSYAVIAQPGSYFGVADSVGKYEMKVPAGIFAVRQITPFGHNMADTQSCQLSGYTVNLPSSNQASGGKDFGNQYRACALLKVSARENSFNCGKAANRNFNICNYGLDTARAAVLKIHYPGSVLSPVSSSIPWSLYNPLDSTLTFTLGNIAPDSRFAITVRDTAVCPGGFHNVFMGFPFTIKLTPLNSCYITDTASNFARFSDRQFIPIAVPSTNIIATAVEVRPNPTNGQIYISGLLSGETVQIFNAFGQKVAEQKALGNAELTIDLGNEVSGIYFVIVRGNLRTETKKIIKL